jgi:hypothetical protein
MYLARASTDPGRYAVDYGHEVETLEPEDETDLGEQCFAAGMERAEEELWSVEDEWLLVQSA